MSAKDVMKMIEDQDVKFIDFRFTDTIGKEQHVSVPAHTIDIEKLKMVTVPSAISIGASF